MKKIKNLVIGGIENKIFNLVLITTILIVAVYSVVISHQAKNLHNLVTETNGKQKESISAISEMTMDSVVTNTLANDTLMKATIADTIFTDVENNVRIMADYAQVLFDEPESVSPESAARPDPSMDGTVSVQLMADKGVDFSDPDLSARLARFLFYRDPGRGLSDRGRQSRGQVQRRRKPEDHSCDAETLVYRGSCEKRSLLY